MNRITKLCIVVIALIFCVLINIKNAKAVVLNFDSFSDGDNLGGSSYGGFNWDSRIYAQAESTYNSGWFNTVNFPTKEIAVYNGFGVPTVTITKSSNFDFNGAYFTMWSTYDSKDSFSSDSITMSGYNGATLIGSVTYALTNDFAYYTANFTNIDRLELGSSGCAKWWLMDNFTHNIVPEPATMSLLGLGLLGLLFRKKERIKDE